jgi:hypothetical protein
LPIPRLATDSLTYDQQPERKHQRDDDEQDRKAAFGTAPFLPVGDPITHLIAPANPRTDRYPMGVVKIRPNYVSVMIKKA